MTIWAQYTVPGLDPLSIWGYTHKFGHISYNGWALGEMQRLCLILIKGTCMQLY